MKLSSSSPDATQRIAARIAALCRAGDCLLLRGDLGTGKTAFARGFIHALCDAPGEVASPTFSLLQTYPMRGGGTVSHFDLYRLKHAGELREIGLHEALQQSLCLIEWPQIMETYWPQEALLVDMDYGDHEQARSITLTPVGPGWAGRLSGLAL